MASQTEDDALQALNPSQEKIEAAFKRFEEAIYPSDVKLFRDSTLEDVWKAARAIESNQSARRSLRNTRRIQPLFDALRLLGNALDPLCQGVPYLCYLWAPIKLALVIFDRHITAYEKIIEAYSQIVQNLPRFDRLGNTFRDQPEFQGVLADVYVDILEFHLEVHKIARRSGWRRLFDACWRDFSGRLSAILKNLATNRDLVDREAASFEILESKELRRILKEENEKNDKDRRDEYTREVFNWLDLAGRDREQEDLLSKSQEARVSGTCIWITNHSKVQTWFDDEDPRLVIWVKGKPGSGKTTLAAYLAENAPMSPRSFILCCFCTELLRKGTPDVASVLMRLFCAQILRAKHDLLAFVYEDFVRTKGTASIKKVRDLLKLLLESLGTVFLILDGLDEYDLSEQDQIIEEFARFLKPCLNDAEEDLQPRVKLMICSRETKTILQSIKKRLNRSLVVNLTDEHCDVSKDIAKFARARLSSLYDRFDETVISNVGDAITEKADGMFLWVHLIVGILQDQWSVEDLKDTIHDLPKGLNGVYKTILDQLRDCPSRIQSENARRILGLLAHARRPLKCHEVCDGVVFHKEHGILDAETKLEKGALDICKPLIEERQRGHISLVHFTARIYLLDKASGPFLPSPKTELQIALSCIRYLSSSKVFVSEPHDPKVTAQVIKGFHDFFPYAYEFWFEHLSSIAVLMKDEGSLHDTKALLEKLWLLFRKEIQIQNHVSAQVEGTGAGSEKPSVESWLLNLSGPIRGYITFKADEMNPSQKACKPLDAEQDPSMLSEAYLQYHSILESLLQGSMPFHAVANLVSKPEIEAFMGRHSGSAFRCHWVGCIRAWTGFSSLEEREHHERSHKQQYRCKELGCLLVFGSRQALRKHKRDYHTKEGDWILPKKRIIELVEEDIIQMPEGLVEGGELSPRFDYPWYKSPNLDLIRQNACKLAAKAQKSDLDGILERMAPKLKKELSAEFIKPLEYHFRKIAIRDFRSLQEEAVDKMASNSRFAAGQPGLRPPLVKNTVFVRHLEAEAAEDIDATLCVVLSRIFEMAEGENDDVGLLWVKE